MFGDLLINKDTSCNIIMTCNNSGRQSAFSSTGDGFTSLYNENSNDASNNRVALWIGSENVENNRLFRINRKVNGVSETFQIYGEHFKPTPADIGALKIYKTFAELGLEEATATPAMIVNAMSNQSMLITYMGENATTSALAPPWTYGTLRVTKFSSKYTMFEYQATSDDTTGLKLVRGYYNDGANVTAIWSGWNRIVDDRNIISLFKENIISGTVAGDRKGLLIYGNTYGNTSTQVKTPGKLSWGDPGPQIIFNTSNSRTGGQPLALIYTDNDTIANGTSLNLVSSESNAWFIAPSIRSITASYSKIFYIQNTNKVSVGNFNSGTDGTTSTMGQAYITVGNNKATGTADNAKGYISFYGSGTYWGQLTLIDGATANRSYLFPDRNGHVVITSSSATGTTQVGSRIDMVAPNSGLARKVIQLFDDSDATSSWGDILVICASGDTYIGGGESAFSLQTAIGATTSENMYVSADNNVYICSNCNTVENRKTFTFTTAGALVVPTNTDYTTFKARNIAAGTSSASITNNGDMYVKY